MPRLAFRVLAGTFVAALAATAGPLPDAAREFLSGNCVACHSGTAPQADVELDGEAIDWTAPAETAKWGRVHDVLADGRMPPRDAPQPSGESRRDMVDWLEGELMRSWGIGGTVPRRLNREEYANTIRAVMDMPEFELPDAFPADDSAYGFDNVGEGLVLSPPVMAQYLEVANEVADRLLPPDTGPETPRTKVHRLGTVGLDVEGGGPVNGGRFRLVSSRNMASAAAWPSRFEAVQSGVYRIKISARPFQTDEMFYARRNTPFRIGVYARPKTEQTYAPFGDIRRLADFALHPNRPEPQVFAAEIELNRQETFGIRWEDGPAFSDPPRREYSPRFLADRLTKDRIYYAAMLEFRGGPRGSTQSQIYEATRALMERGNLDLGDPRLDRLPEVWGGGLSNAPHNWIKAYVHEELLRHGPAIDIVDLEVEGPLRLIEDDEQRRRKERTRRLLGERAPGSSARDQAESVLRRFLRRAFRRPPGDEQLAAYTELAMRGGEERLQDGLHLAVRRALVSPAFLYRGLRPGPLDSFDLASRLSYFLTSSPPDEKLSALADEHALADPAILADQAARLLRGPSSARFVTSFTGQWLSTRSLRSIMPDPRLLQFGEPDRVAMIDEAEMFFAEILRENLPLRTFIDPDFSYRSARLNKIYGGDLDGNQMRRVGFARGGRHGGVLGLAAVMMATANGVDTNPVHRGVWLLENVLGEPTPEPPPDVPAIAPDTSGVASIRNQLAAHRADPTCARCHDRIDPLGMVLENFDPVGRWREHYPAYSRPADGAEALTEEYYSTVGKGVLAGPPIHSVGILADGTRIENAVDLKRHLLDRINLFSRCLTEKLMVYSTGRLLTFGDRRVADRIVESVRQTGNGFQDLILAVVGSESFATR